MFSARVGRGARRGASPQEQASAALALRERKHKQETQPEWERCAADKPYFIQQYCQIYDATVRAWIPFDLWPEQRDALDTLMRERLVAILKARQLGLTWLCLGDALHEMLFHPVATISLFSRRDEESMYLLGDERLKGMYSRLPAWMRARQWPITSNSHTWQLSNGSIARSFPTSAGDSYTASYAFVDEADLVPDLGALMRAVKPTIDGGGRMVLLSRTNKSDPNSEFKATYRGAKAGENGWASVFLPWHVRPSRDEAWYAEQKRDIMSRTGAVDDLWEQYPATDTEALAPRTLDKRIPPAWLLQCYVEQEGITVPDAPAINGLIIYQAPRPGREYRGGLDPAEGNPTSDDSSVTFVDQETGEEVAVLAGKFQPSALAWYADKIGTWYNSASLLVERNNHGHAVLLWLDENSLLTILEGYDEKPGWLSSGKGKALLYSATADAFRDHDALVHNFTTWTQLASIEGNTLRAPVGELDDQADSFALATVARTLEGEVYQGAAGGERTAVQQYKPR